MTLEQLTDSLEKYKRHGKHGLGYIKVLDLLDALRGCDVTEIEDLVLDPLYIIDRATYDLYFYELVIRNVKEPEKEDCILERTHQKRLSDIDKSLLHHLWTCYVEVVDGDIKTAMADIMKYFDYFLNSQEMKAEVEKVVGEFDPENLYFEVY